jgi:hypothetical protein
LWIYFKFLVDCTKFSKNHWFLVRALRPDRLQSSNKSEAFFSFLENYFYFIVNWLETFLEHSKILLDLN